MKNNTPNSGQAADPDLKKNLQENTSTPNHSRGAFNEEPTNNIKGGSIPQLSKPPQTDFDDENSTEKKGKNSNDAVL